MHFSQNRHEALDSSTPSTCVRCELIDLETSEVQQRVRRVDRRSATPQQPAYTRNQFTWRKRFRLVASGKQRRSAEDASMVTTIRQAVLADVEALVPLFDAYRTFFAGGTPTGSKEFLSERLSKNDAVFFMSFDGNTATGFLTLYPLFSSWYATTIWFLSDLYVAPEYRNQKLGRRLVAAAQEFAKEKLSRSIMVEIPHREPHLVSFYESLSFERDKDFNLYRFYLKT